MIEYKEKAPRKGVYQKPTEMYVDEPRLGDKAVKKEAIVSKYSESYQLNVMRKALLGDTEALATLQEIEDYINEAFKV